MSRKPLLLAAALAVLMLQDCRGASGKSLSDEELWERYILPKAREFAAKPGLPFPDGLTRNLIRKWRIDRRKDGEPVVASVFLTNRLVINFYIQRTNVVVVSFFGSRINPHSIAGDETPERAKFYAKLPDQFTLESAREFALAFFKATGHKPENFRLFVNWQVAWGDPKDKANYIPLPFYQFDWLRKDVKEVKPGEIHHPRVSILVSGLNRQVLGYTRAFLPIRGDFEDAERP